ncbi:MAG: alpha-ketoglutarate-dependent dioxygenase AlkB [Alphaproteobacteria bacterium]|nr:alpha-ketoglutarate-dependent dioxygenase AlkB [Alphaproteobacteria bacterium]
MTADLPVAAGFERVAIPNADVFYLPRLELRRSDAELLRRLVAEVPWRAETVMMWGRPIRQPRLTAWFGDPGSDYTYSGLQLAPIPWTALLRDIKTRVEEATGWSFNSVLVNYYRDHRDSIGYHSDDEPELGERPRIASLSLGAARTFVMKPKTSAADPVRLRLGSGSLLLMAGETQKHWRHGVPKENQACGPRINLTFRTIVR